MRFFLQNTMNRTTRALAFAIVVNFLLLGAANFVDPIPVLEEEEVVSNSTSQQLGYDWFTQGTFTNIGLTNYSSFTDVGFPTGHIAPNPLTTGNVNWQWSDGFNDQSSGDPNGMNCEGSTRYESGGSFHVYQDNNPWDYTGCWVQKSSWQPTNGQGTFQFDAWIEDALTTSTNGTKFHTAINYEEFQFSLSKAPNGTLYGHVWPHNQPVSQMHNCGFSTVDIPFGSSTADYDTWRTMFDDNLQEAILLQDGVLRCRLPYWTNTNYPFNDAFVIGSRGDANDKGIVHFDQIGYTGGHLNFVNSGTWTSAQMDNPEGRHYDSITFDWWMPGVGTYTDIQRAIRLSVIDVATNNPIPGYDQLAPPQDVGYTSKLDLSGIDEDTNIKIEIDWIAGMTDWVSLKSANFLLGAIPGEEFDLVAGYGWHHSDVGGANETIRNGDALTIAFESSHTGDIVDQPVFVELLMNGISLGTQNDNVQNMAGQNGKTWTWSFEQMTTGIYDFQFIIDGNNDLDEVDETNNEATYTVYVHPTEGPSLVEPVPVQHPISQRLDIGVSSKVDQADITKLYVDWGDGDSNEYIPFAGTLTTYHWYQDYGIYDISFQADLEGGLESFWTNISVIVTNEDPVAVIRHDDAYSLTGEEIYLSGLESTDWHADVLSYEWAIDGQLVSSNGILTHTFSEVGEYEIKFFVHDDQGGMDSITMDWRVYSKKPMGYIAELQALDETTQYEDDWMDIKVWYDIALDEDLVANFTLEWSANGEALETIYLGNDEYSVHLPSQSGAQEIVLKATNPNNGVYDAEILDVMMVNIPPTIDSVMTLDNIQTAEAANIAVQYSGVELWEEENATYSLIAPDGSVSEYSLTDEIWYVPLFTGEHAMQLILNDGDELAYHNFTITALNLAPELNVTCHDDVIEGDLLECFANVSDVGEDVDPTAIVWRVNGGLSQVGSQSFYYQTTGPGVLNLVISYTDSSNERVEFEYSALILEKEDPNTGESGEDEEFLTSALGLGVIGAGVLVVILLITLLITIRSKSGKDEKMWE